ncbi:MAG TPA: hypothetical protein VGK93_05995 [Candidatus Eisenbacteria bacterium]
MGQETRCLARIGRRALEGRVLLESTEIVFRGEERVVVPFDRIESAAALDGELRLEAAGRTVTFELGPLAEKWLAKIRNPKPVIDKLGVKPGQVISVLGVADPGFLKEAKARAKVIVGRLRKGSDWVFLAADSQAALRHLAAARDAIARDGAIWVVWPKGHTHIKEDHVRAAGKAAGLVDIKVVAFSTNHSALKLVIPVAKR